SAAPSDASFSTRLIARATARMSPESTRALSVAGGVCTPRCSATRRAPRVLLLGEQLACDHEALNLARALANRRELDVTKVLLGRIVLDEAVAAEDLHGVLGRPHGNLTRVQLRDRGLACRPCTLILEP